MTVVRERGGGQGADAGHVGAADSVMSHREILEALAGLLTAMFVAMLSSTVVSNALPRILADLHGGETAYTWVVTATLLTLTASTPIWGKLSDQFDRKLMMQLAIVVYVGGSALAGATPGIAMLITARAVQGVGAGGIMAMTQIILAAMIPPRQRGRYTGYIGAVFAVATLLGPLIGGVIVDTSWLGWRWCFYVGIPFAALALVLLQTTLHLPAARRKVTVDYLGAATLVGGVCLLLIWVSLAGAGQFAWASAQTAVMVPVAAALLVATVLVERRAADPIVPLHLFAERTVSLATVASLFIGVALFGATVFLSQYFQIARAKSPTVSGLLTLPLVFGLFATSLITGRIITRTGRWKRYLVGGGLVTVVGFALLSTIRADTAFWLVALFMFVTGAGVGGVMQNLVLAVQNTVRVTELGAATSTVSFFRSLGGAMGVSVLGAVLGARSTHLIENGLARLGPVPGAAGHSTQIPDVRTLPAPVAAVVQSAFGQAVGLVFLIAVPFLIVAAAAISAIREVPLRQTLGAPETPESAGTDLPNASTGVGGA
jgi:EmrB/QacA subfamily drug resistance transporter